MHVRSLGYRTDLIFPAYEGEVIDRGDFLVIRTPANSAFFWGNYLLFPKPPQDGDYRKWRDLFAQEVGGPPEIEHQAFGWDSPEGNEGIVQPFLHAGFRLDRSVVMTSDRLRPPARLSDFVSIRPLKTVADWEQALENQILCRDLEFEETGYRVFRRRQMDRYRKMVESDLGDWFGAFADERLVADLGIFRDEDIGRFQSVETHPKFRRRGIGGTLAFEAGRQAIAKHNLNTLVIVAEEESSAARLYRSIGFTPVEKQVGLEWHA
jgi:ribosomal protein S18 acetylase RimI-like enzyme